MKTKIGIFNARGHEESLQVVDRLTENAWIMRLCETCLTDKDDQLRTELGVTVETPTATSCRRRYGGVPWNMNPILFFREQSTYALKKIHYRIVKVGHTVMNILHKSLKSQKQEERELLTKIKGVSGALPIIMG